jgi:hypothetical protein
VLQRLPQSEPEDTVLIVDGDAGSPDRTELSTDAHAVLGVDPPHGSFRGGQTAIVRGNGFSSAARVWLGSVELSDGDVIALDPNRLQITVPPGEPGPVDVSVQIADADDTRRTRADAYLYDAFTIEPSSGPTAGGSSITLVGKGTDWDEDTQVLIDLRPCDVVSVEETAEGLQELTCITPEGTEGRKVVTTQNPKEEAVSVTGAFEYSDAATTVGGILGKPFNGSLEVIVRDDLFGTPLGGMSVVLGQGQEPGQVAVTDDTGTVNFAGLDEVQTVTVLGECVQPLTVVAVPSELLVLYVEPVITPPCIPPSFDLPSLGGSPGAARLNRIVGELSWGTGIENKRAGWNNVPQPVDDEEERSAYVFELAPNSRVPFRLPSTIHAVKTDDPGALGYEFGFDTRSVGNVTLYAFAGVETRRSGSRVFTPYVMGILKGVDPSDDERRPVIPMDIVLDHRLVVDVESPKLAAAGPDRLQLSLLLRVGREGFIPLPVSERTLYLPVGNVVEFAGVPPLINGLDGAQYVVSASAVTGTDEGVPLADIEAIATRTTDKPIPVGGFIEIPRLKRPASGAVWDMSRLVFDDSIEGNYDLWTANIAVGGELFRWRVVSPAGQSRVDLPDPAEFGVNVPDGPATINVSAARVRDFDYGELEQTSFGASGWAAYSKDLVTVYVER